MASLFKVKALYEFEAKEDDDLGFSAGQIIDVTEEIDDNWLEGRYTDASGGNQNGIFPREFVEKYEPEVPTRPTRPTRAKQEPAPIQSTPVAAPNTGRAVEEDEAPLPPSVPASSKPPPAQVEVSAPVREDPTESAPPTVALPVKAEPPQAPKPTPAELATPASAKKAPPIAPKSNAFKDRIAAFNAPAAAPIAPIVPGGTRGPQAYIKKPFVAPPPLANSYVPPPKVEPVHRPYIREEDPEIRRRQEEDHAAAEAAGLTNEPNADQGDDEEDAPKPTSLKERIARLQQQQMEQAQRRAEGGPKKEKKPPVKKPSESSEQASLEPGDDGPQRQRSIDVERQSLDSTRDRPRVPTSQHQIAESMSPVPPAPDHELVSDGNEADQSAAGETTEDDTGTIGPEDSDDIRAVPTPLPRAAGAPKREPDVGDEEDTTEEGEEDEDSMDEETRRRMELRERMAKMSGGMGMPGMFGGMPMPGAGAKKRAPKETKPAEEEEPLSTSAPRIPMIPIPGMNRVQSPDSDLTQTEKESHAREEQDDDEEDLAPPTRRSTNLERGAPPPVPSDSRPSQERGPPPPIPSSGRPTAPESRPVPPPPAPLQSPDPGAESDDEASLHPSQSISETPYTETPVALPIRGAAPAVPVQSPESKRTSYFNNEPSSSTDKRASRAPPPVPGSPVTSPRPPPPPPPTAQASRSATMHEDDQDRGESEYEGDYDTDIASSAKHKDALKAHLREPSLDDSTTADEAPQTPPAPPPHATAPRAVPPPPPQSAPKSRASMDAPRAPPPVPPMTSPRLDEDEDDYDPYRYDGRERSPPPAVSIAAAMVTPPPPPRDAPMDQQSAAPQPRMSMEQGRSQPPRERAVPPPPPQELLPQRAPPRQSLDVQRTNTSSRRSAEIQRPGGENGQIANDIDLGENTQWYTNPQPLPPVLQSRNGIDVLTECEESTTSKRGGRTTVVKDIYVLFIDYSQTIITVQYDAKEPSDAHLEQRHLPPPPKLRQDQLETYWQRFGAKISQKANSLGGHKEVLGDGSPGSLVAELVKEHQDALQPIGQRSYGALVYANLANASTMQFDEIRPGDIVTLRNSRFEGSHGAMKHKYKQEYGPSHVAIVEEWDGTKRSIRAWEQGREKKEKVRSEKFRLGDLKSGEVRVWRVVGRDWVDWQS